MENALHVIRLSKHDDFDVQTSLFSYRMATRIFPTSGNHIPAEIVEKVRELKDSSDLIDKSFVTSDNVWDDYRSVYRTDLFTGVEVETFAFQDAGYIHAAVNKIVEEFISSHERVVMFVKKD